MVSTATGPPLYPQSTHAQSMTCCPPSAPDLNSPCPPNDAVVWRAVPKRGSEVDMVTTSGVFCQGKGLSQRDSVARTSH